MNRKFRAAGGKSLYVERLEARRVMAGNILAEVIDGTLFIDGDELANGIAILATETPNEVLLIPVPAVAGDVTYLNDQTGHLTFEFTEDIVIRMGAGNDGVELNNIYVPRDLTIDTGDGLDRVSIGSVLGPQGRAVAPFVAWPPVGEVVPGGMILDPNYVPTYTVGEVVRALYAPLNQRPGVVMVARDLSIDTGGASDYVYLGQSQVIADFALRSGEGDDVLVMHTVSARRMDAGMGRGHDLANIANLATRVQMTLETGFGNDFVSYAGSYARGPATFLGGHDNNQIYIGASVFSSSLYAATGADNDYLAVKSSMLLGNSTFITSGGSDRVDIDYSFGRFVSFNTGTAVDAIVIRGSALDNIYAAMGDGDDHLSLVTTRILHPFIIDGGVGANDVLHSYGSATYYIATPGFEHKTSNWPWWLTM
jgi:hypothetical protein